MRADHSVMTPADGLVWITGASQGIGRALTVEMVSRGWLVAVSARDAAALQALADELPGKVLPFPADVTDRAAMAEIVTRVAKHGPLALAVLNAGIYTPMRGHEFDAAVVARGLAVNVQGVANALEPLIAQMLAQGRGHIALMASVAGYRGLPHAAAYGPTKAALISLAESLWFDLAPRNIRVSVINPGFVRTAATAVNDFEMPFLLEPTEAARRIADGLARPGFEITFPRRFAWVLKLLRLLPIRLYLRLVYAATGWGRMP